MKMASRDQPLFIQRLKAEIRKNLPGYSAQKHMMPEGREEMKFNLRSTAAVLLILYEDRGEWRFPLIKRVEDGFVHSGQIGLPGGRPCQVKLVVPGHNIAKSRPIPNDPVVTETLSPSPKARSKSRESEPHAMEATVRIALFF